MYYLVYKITNKVNQKIYVGAHCTENIHDDYMGSGHALNRAKKKYGLENFVKEVLFVFDNEQDMWAKEKEIVNEEFCLRKDTYNVRTGGIGGWNHWNGSKRHREIAKAHGPKYGKRLNEFMAHHRANNTDFWKEWLAKVNKANQTKNNNSWINYSQEEYETRRRIMSERSQGPNNSQYGRYWISNIETKEVKRIGSSEPIPEGWVRGKKGHLPTKCWINDGKNEHYILISDKEKYIMLGYKDGRLYRQKNCCMK